MTTKFEFLASHPVFEYLTDAELRALSRISKEYAFEEDAVIAFQGDVADAMVIVKSGRLFGRRVEQGVAREVSPYSSGDYFGEMSLFEPGTHRSTVIGTDPGRILMIHNRDFLEFLAEYPDALASMEPVYDDEGNVIGGLSPAAWEQASKLAPKDERQYIGEVHLLPDELVEYYSRRSIWALVLELLGPVLTLVVLTAVLLYVRGLQPILEIIGLGGLILVWILFGALIFYRLFDWRNDYFVITNKFIYRRDFNLRTFRTEYNKVPIEQLQSVSVERPTIWANLLDFGSARITTAATAGIVEFDNIDDPGEVAQAIDNLRGRVEERSVAEAQTNMREAVESHFELQPAYAPVEGEEEEVAAPKPVARRNTLATAWSRLFGWRQVEGDVITYRKNRFVLLGYVALPLLFLVLLAVGVVFALSTPVLQPFSTLIAVLGAALFLVGLFWLLWQYEDWRNDTFQLTNQYVIDIDRKPFGFSERRAQAPLSNIQNINAIRPGFIATLLNYGNVVIETAGATADITFENVPEPNEILRDIFARLETVREKQRRLEGAQRRQEYAVLLDVYKQELEVDRIPRRTPPPEDMDGLPGNSME